MKKLFALLLVMTMVFSMVACGQTSADVTNTETATQEAAVQVDEGLFTVEVTIASALIGESSEEEIKAAAQEKGYDSCTFNEDGSVTYTMSKTKHQEALAEYKANVESVIASMVEGEEKVESFVSIEHNDNFSQVDIYIDSSKYTAWDALYAITFYISGGYYQAFAGTAAEDIDVVVNFIDNDTKEVKNSGSYKAYMANNTESESEAESEEVVSTPIDATPIGLDETITIEDTCEFYIDYSDITDTVYPPSVDGYYTYYPADDGKLYVDICVAYKNLDTTDKDADEVANATLIFGGKYKYNSFCVIEEDSRSDFTYANITSIAPLSTEYLHYLFAVPEEINDSEGMLSVILNIKGNQYSFIVREGIEGDVASLNENAVVKTNGNVNAGEIIAVMNACEFYVDYSNITSVVEPPQPADYYTYYEADDGKVFVDFCVAYKNWKSTGIRADDVISAKLTYAGKYEYTGSAMIEEESRGDFTYANITDIAPLTTEYVHILFAVPEEVENSTDSVVIDFTIGGNTYSYTVR